MPGITNDWIFSRDADLILKEETFLDPFQNLQIYFDLPLHEIFHLFAPNHQFKKIDPECEILRCYASFETVQKNLQRFLTLKDIDYKKEAQL